MVEKIGVTTGGYIVQYTGRTEDTAAFLVDPQYLVCGPGSTYREVNGEFRLYELQSGEWLLQG